MKWLREAISDDAGLADMAYLVIGALAVAAVAALVFIFALSAISYSKCAPVTTVQTAQTAKDKDSKSVHVVPCNFDALPVGQAAGLIFGAFATLIASLSAYMAATRRKSGERPGSTVEEVTHRTETVTSEPPAVAKITTKGKR